MPHQFQNYMEICSLIYRKNQDAVVVRIKLTTWNEPEYQKNTGANLEEIKDSLSEMNIELEYEFKGSAMIVLF